MSEEKLLNAFEEYVRFMAEAGYELNVPVGRVRSARSTGAQAAATPRRPAADASSAARRKKTAPADRDKAMESIVSRVSGCTSCVLHESRTKTVPGQGSFNPEIMFVGEAPGADEDRQGKAFVGRAGQLLTKMIEAMGYTRDDVFIGNILKCRPPGNRKPLPGEMDTCLPYLREQIGILEPDVIIALGTTAVKGLFDVDTGITRMRGKWLTFEGIDVMPTYHPAYLLRNPAAKREAWEDLKAVLRHLGREIPGHNKQG
jgi:DNA polymerase